MDQSQYISRIANDKDFRNRLRTDAKSALAETGTDTGDVQIKVVEDTATVLHIAMPSNPNVLLDDSTLEDVAGGGWNPFKKVKSSSFGSVGSCASSADVAKVR